MKKIYIILAAVLTVVLSACTSEESALARIDEGGKGVPFSATISMPATTRGLTEAADGKSISAAWAVDEQLALIHGKNVDVMTVKSVDATTGVATIEGTINSATEGEDVQVVYIGSKGMDAFKNQLNKVLEAASNYTSITKAHIDEAVIKLYQGNSQAGTLAAINDGLDYRYATSTLTKPGKLFTFKAAVTPESQLAVWKITLNDGADALSTTELYVKDGDNALAWVKSSQAVSVLYVTMPAISNKDLTIEATVGTDKYTATKTSVTLAAGKFYRSTLAMKAPEPGKMTVSATGYKAVYDSNAHGITVSVTEPATGATIKYGEKEGTYNLDASPTYTNAGTYTVYYQVTMDKYETVTGSAKVEITQAAGSISFKDATVTRTYGDAVFTNTLTKTGDGTVTYSSDKASVATVNATTGEVTIVGPGTATIKATVADGTNYNYATKEVSYTLTVKPQGGVEDYNVNGSTEW